MAFTPIEEALLRDILVDKSPLKVTNPEHLTRRGANESAGAAAAYVDDQLRRSRTKPVDLNEDQEVTKKLRKLKFRETETAEVNGFSVAVSFPKQGFLSRLFSESPLAPGAVYALGVSREEILRLPVDELKRRIVSARAAMIENGDGGFDLHSPAPLPTRPNNPSFLDTGTEVATPEYEQFAPESV